MTAVPAFESLPGANHTIYLDFDGQLVENTGWNSYYNQTSLLAKPFDIDGDTSSFNATELARIEEAYLRVAEDFRPFNVNVTTIEPAVDRLQKTTNSDTRWGVRVIVTNESTMVNDPADFCGCGGIAYIDSFNSSADVPVWVYTSGGKSIAEAASHEAGHALGLSHDGTSTAGYYRGHGSGETGWAPIMGVGYYQNVTQWDDGTYFDSNNTGSSANYGKGADDLAVITTYNGFGYRADDHGGSHSTASPLSISGTTINDSGVIERSSDVDVYSFTTGAGPVTLNVSSFTPGPNLDLRADLYDSSNTLVASSNPISGLNASLSLTLPAGQYYVHVRGVGVGSPTTSSPSGYSNYASLGSYSIGGSIVDPGTVAQLSINDVIVNEGAGTATFTVTLSGTADGDVSVNYGTVNQSATANTNTGTFDYAAATGSLVFVAGGASTKTVTIQINDDNLVEGNETFALNLSGAVGAFIADGQGIGTIIDNDASVAIGNASATEGNLANGKKNSGSPNLKDMVFSVTLSNAVDHDVTVAWATQDGTATTTNDGNVANDDYVTNSGTVTIRAGEVASTIVVQVVGDNNSELDEAFYVNLGTPVGATIASGAGTATGTILNDDSSGGGGGGGGGRGKPNKLIGDSILVVDELWYFEPVDHEHDHDHDHQHQEPTLPSAVASSPVFSRVQDGLQRDLRDDRAVLSTDSIDEVMKLLTSIDIDADDKLPCVRFDDFVSDEPDASDDSLTSAENTDELSLVVELA